MPLGDIHPIAGLAAPALGFGIPFLAAVGIGDQRPVDARRRAEQGRNVLRRGAVDANGQHLRGVGCAAGAAFRPISSLSRTMAASGSIASADGAATTDEEASTVGSFATAGLK